MKNSTPSSAGNPLKEKSYQFSLRIVKAVRYLQEQKKEYILTNQLLPSGTSIGANIHEALASISKKEFICKLQIALKEAKETEYWLQLLCDSDYFIEKEYLSLFKDNSELIALLTSIIKSSKKNIIRNDS